MASTLRTRPLGPLALAFLAVTAAGCQTTHPTATADTTGSVAVASSVPTEAAGGGEPRREFDTAGARYRANPGDPEAAIRYAAALRTIGERAQASAVLEQASIKHPTNKAVLAAYGRALADAGNYAQAFEVLGQAHTPDQPDSRLLSVQGAVLDQMGRHEEARRYYASALKLAPDDPAVLSNLGCLADVPYFGPTGGAVTEFWFSPPGGMPMGLTVGATTTYRAYAQLTFGGINALGPKART